MSVTLSGDFRGAFSYVKRVTLKTAKRDFAAKFITARAQRKALALQEMSLLSELDHERILYFHDAFEKKNVIVIITELYPYLLFRDVTKSIHDLIMKELLIRHNNSCRRIFSFLTSTVLYNFTIGYMVTCSLQNNSYYNERY